MPDLCITFVLPALIFRPHFLVLGVELLWHLVYFITSVRDESYAIREAHMIKSFNVHEAGSEELRRKRVALSPPFRLQYPAIIPLPDFSSASKFRTEVTHQSRICEFDDS